MFYKICFGIFISFIAVPLVLTQRCTTSPIREETLVSGISGGKYCEYTENFGSKPIQIFPGTEIITKECKRCSCSGMGLRCCAQPKPPTDIPSYCKVVPDGCKFQIVLRSDPSVECYSGQTVVKQSEGNTLKNFLLSPDGMIVTGFVQKIVGMIKGSVNRFTRSRRRNRPPFLGADGEYEPSLMELMMYNQPASTNPFFGGQSFSGPTHWKDSLMKDIMGTFGQNTPKQATGGNTGILDILSGNSPTSAPSSAGTAGNHGLSSFLFQDLAF